MVMDVTTVDDLPGALVVDDDPGMRELLSESLTQFGFECTEAASGDEALNWLAWESFDLIVLDIRMADTNGLEVLQRAREEHLGTAMLMVSGLTTPDAQAKSKALGADGFLAKPFTLGQLGGAVRRAYDQRDLGLEDEPAEEIDQPPPERRYPFTVEAVNQAPDRTGVYVLYQDDAILYMGSANSGNDTLLTILRAHRRGDINEVTLQATHFAREIHAQASDRLASLLRQYQEAHDGAIPPLNELLEPQQMELAG